MISELFAENEFGVIYTLTIVAGSTRTREFVHAVPIMHPSQSFLSILSHLWQWLSSILGHLKFCGIEPPLGRISGILAEHSSFRIFRIASSKVCDYNCTVIAQLCSCSLIMFPVRTFKHTYYPLESYNYGVYQNCPLQTAQCYIISGVPELYKSGICQNWLLKTGNFR